MIEVIRSVADAVEWGKQYHDMTHGDFSSMANPERAVIIMYRHIKELEEKIAKYEQSSQLDKAASVAQIQADIDAQLAKIGPSKNKKSK